MRAITLLASILIVLGVVWSLDGEEMIKDKSPDGKFALRLIHGEEGWETSIVELPSKKKIIDLEVVATSGDHERRAWVASVDTFRIEDYAKDAKLVWSNDSQRVAYFNEDRVEHTMSVYFRNGSSFEEMSLPGFPKCDEIKNQDVEIVHFGVKPIYWIDSSALSVTVEHWWRTPKGDLKTCEPTFTITFDAQRQASVAKAEKPPEEIGKKIESPNGTFFVEELNAPAKDDEGRPRMDQGVWIVSAKDPATRERLPDLYEEEGSGGLASATISPDEKWILFNRHYGSHLNSTYLFRCTDGLKFEDAFPDNRFDDVAWKFFSKVEGVSFKKIDANDLGPTSVSVLEWSEDSGRLLLDLHGGLTGNNDIAYRDEDYKKPGVSGWVAYYNTKTRKFELTDRLRKWNKNARTRWMASDAQAASFLPPSAESIGREGADAPVAERLKKYQAALAAMEERRKTQLGGADRAEFEKNEAEWRETLDKEIAQIKDKPTQLGLRARSTWYRVDGLRESWWPVYEERK